MRRDRYKLNMCRSRMTPKSLAEAEGFRGRQRCTGRLPVSELPNLYQTGETTEHFRVVDV